MIVLESNANIMQKINTKNCNILTLFGQNLWKHNSSVKLTFIIHLC